MRSFVRHGLVVGTCLGALLASAGCEQKKATEYVTGVSTQVTVPKYLKAVRIQIANRGFVEFCQNYKVYDGKVLLPRSLGNFPQSSDGNRNSITFSIVGLTETQDENPGNPVFSDCVSSAAVNANNVRILRRSTQPYVPDHILFLPMALKYSCFDKNCNENETCKGGVCVPDTTDPATLEEYTDGMGDGLDGACFSMPLCMGAVIPAVPVNEADCTFAVAESADANAIKTLPKDKNPFRPLCTPENAKDVCGLRNCTDGQCDLLPPDSPPWTGVNVEITYDGAGTKEILDLDAEEGFTIPDPAKPQTFRLAPGLCQMLKGGKDAQGKPLTAHRITSVRAAGTCAPKKASQSICAVDQLKIMGANDDGTAANIDAKNCTTQLLTPSKSALILLVDNTTGHASFFDKDVQDELKVPLQDPAFEQTDIGVLLADSTSACTAPAAPTLTPALPDGVNGILTQFKTTPTDPGEPNIEAQLRNAYTFLGNLPASYARRAVIVLGNRKLNENACSDDALTPVQLADAEFKKTGSAQIATFAAKLTNAGEENPAQQLAEVGSPRNADSTLKYHPQATTAEYKKEALQAAISYLATCVYDYPEVNDVKTAPPEGATLSYANPLIAAEVKIPALPATTTACSADPDQEGWFNDVSDPANPRVTVCNKSCTAYQKVLADTSTFTLLYGQPSIPVPLYVSSKECFEKK